MRGLRNRSFKSILLGGWNQFKENLVKQARTRMIAGGHADFKKLGEQYDHLDIDVNKRLISIDGGEYKTPEQWKIDNEIGDQKFSQMNMALFFCRLRNIETVRVNLQKGDMTNTMISINGHAEVPFAQTAMLANEKPTDLKQVAFIEQQLKIHHKLLLK